MEGTGTRNEMESKIKSKISINKAQKAEDRLFSENTIHQCGWFPRYGSHHTQPDIVPQPFHNPRANQQQQNNDSFRFKILSFARCKKNSKNKQTNKQKKEKKIQIPKYKISICYSQPSKPPHNETSQENLFHPHINLNDPHSRCWNILGTLVKICPISDEIS